ncbi:MAG: alpha-2-macroglobulin [Treponema sp.]|nr:alpha-2-macroglobulin [Treponema sp.]
MNQNGGETAPAGEVPPSGETADPGVQYVTQEMIDATFTLDYTAQMPEAVQSADVMPAESLSAAIAGGGDSAGGGLRKLADYKTSYYNTERETERIRAIAEAQAAAARGTVESADPKAPLTVIDWGPRGFFSSAVQRPSLHVVFSEPMVPLASLGAKSAVSNLVTITPPLKGSFRWYGTSFLSFEAEEPCASQQIYRITVNPQAVSLSGKKISGERSFSFTTEALKLTRMVVGEAFRKRTNSWYTSEVPPDASSEVSLYFNYPVSAADLKPYVAVSTVSGGAKNFTLAQLEANKLLLTIAGKLEFDTTVTVVLKKGARSANATLGTAEDDPHSFSTPPAFTLSGIESVHPYGAYKNLTVITFTARLNRAALAGKIHTEPAMPFNENNMEISGSQVRLFNLPVAYSSSFRVRIDAGVEDVYGRRLGRAYNEEVKVPEEPPPQGSVRFLDESYDTYKMLEAQFDPRYLFEYRNVTAKSAYTLASRNNPYSAIETNKKSFPLETGINQRYFADMDLKPWLDNGKGFVSFNAEVEYITNTFDRRKNAYTAGTRTISNSLVLQVTDLGLTVRAGFNKTLVLVTSLQSGKPVAGARVSLINYELLKDAADISELPVIAQGQSGENGLAVLTHEAGTFRGQDSDRNFVYAEKDGDRAVFQPSDHNPWAFDIYPQSLHRAEVVQPVTFLFTDRGIYKPGETVSFRGVDRSLAAGNYLVYQGDYTVSLSDNHGTEIAKLEGSTSESGGFFGAFTLPENVTPSYYNLYYMRRDRDGSVTQGAAISVQVAYFERLKFQLALTPSPPTVFAGDTVNVQLKASYLSGGSLGGAGYEAVWRREMSWQRLSSKTIPNLDAYRFGPYRAWEGGRSLGEAKGILAAGGTASLSQKSEAGVVGAPYEYSVDARVTDLSNQMIASSASVIVHPARFYLGVSRPASRGFPKAGEEISFEYLALTPSGERAQSADFSTAATLVPAAATSADQSGSSPRLVFTPAKIEVELFREEWRLVQQEGAANTLYDSYVNEMISEQKMTIALRPSGGFTVKPPRAGSYTLRMTALDSAGRKVLTETAFYATGSAYRGYWNMNSANEIKLTPDQDTYNPGDTAQILLQSPLPSGEYLITVERDGIFSEELRHLDEGTTVLEIPVARNYMPVVYVSVSSYSVRSGPPNSEYGKRDLDKPKGCYGICGLKVNPRVKAFSIVIEEGALATYKPGETVNLTLKAEQHGLPLSGAELTLLAVDRGVLDLINYHVPDPVSFFYDPSRFPLRVEGGDSRSLLIDPVTYNIKNLRGGDSEGKGDEEPMNERDDFNPTAVFEPMLKTDQNGRVTASFKLPDNLTTYRITVFGVRGDLFGLKESEIAARNQINVTELQPRRLRERDTGEAGVLITNLDSAAHKVNVSLAVSPASGDAGEGRRKIPGGAFVDGASEQQITVKPGSSAAVYFDLAAEREGVVQLAYTIRSDILNEKLVRELIIEKPYVMETVTTMGEIGRDSASAREGLVIPGWADNGRGSLAVSLDATRLGLLDQAVSYLFDYPYGCLEQRSAAVFPLVVFGDYIDAFSLKSRVSNPRQAAETEIAKWGKLQLADGGFPYWPGTSRTSSHYVTLRVAHIIALAGQKNMAVPASIDRQKLAAYLNRLYQETQKWSGRDGSFRSYYESYLLYVSALLGENPAPSRLAEIAARGDADAASLAFAGMSYRLLNKNSEAAAVAAKLRNLLRMNTRGVDITDPRDGAGRPFRYEYYGNKIEQLALTLQFFADQYPGDAINGRILSSLLQQKRSSGYWDSTAVTVRVLSAVDALIRAEKLDEVNVTGSVSLANTRLFTGTYRGLGAKPSGTSLSFNQPPLAAMARDTLLGLNINRSGQGALYYTASLSYAVPEELQSYRDEGFGVFMTIVNADTGAELTGTRLKSGQTYRARIRLSTLWDRTYVALRVPLPSGAEILDATLLTSGAASYRQDESDDDEYNDYDEYDDYDRYYWDASRGLSSMAVMDNEVQYFWDSLDKGEASVEFLFRAGRRGVYPTPPLQAECMYESEIFGRSAGAIYTIE